MYKGTIEYKDEFTHGEWRTFTCTAHSEDACRKTCMEVVQPSDMTPNVEWRNLKVEPI